MNIEIIFDAVKDIGLPSVLIILLLLFQFRSIIKLEKEKEKLLDLLLKHFGGEKNGRDKIDN
ncbi:hypothetical protein HY793_02965 [Candidatus Desantisbacteria bacterium]|nr:hypothetical protein [Candidatus Desantisbacteria bacterium]